jgi:hypothetical protein
VELELHVLVGGDQLLGIADRKSRAGQTV